MKNNKKRWFNERTLTEAEVLEVASVCVRAQVGRGCLRYIERLQASEYLCIFFDIDGRVLIEKVPPDMIFSGGHGLPLISIYSDDPRRIEEEFQQYFRGRIFNEYGPKGYSFFEIQQLEEYTKISFPEMKNEEVGRFVAYLQKGLFFYKKDKKVSFFRKDMPCQHDIKKVLGWYKEDLEKELRNPQSPKALETWNHPSSRVRANYRRKR